MALASMSLTTKQGTAREDDTSVYTVACSVASLEGLCDLLETDLENRARSEATFLHRAISKPSLVMVGGNPQQYCHVLTRGVSLICLLVNVMIQMLDNRESRQDRPEHIVAGARALGCKIVPMISSTAQRIIKLTLAAEHLRETGDGCFRSLLSLVRASINLALKALPAEPVTTSPTPTEPVVPIGNGANHFNLSSSDTFDDLDDEAFLSIDIDGLVAAHGGASTVSNSRTTTSGNVNNNCVSHCNVGEDRNKAWAARSADSLKTQLWPDMVGVLQSSRPSSRFQVNKVSEAITLPISTSGKKIAERQAGAICEVLASMCVLRVKGGHEVKQDLSILLEVNASQYALAMEDISYDERVRQCFAAVLCNLRHHVGMRSVLGSFKNVLLALFLRVSVDAELISHFPTEDFKFISQGDGGRFATTLSKARKRLKRAHDANRMGGNAVNLEWDAVGQSLLPIQSKFENPVLHYFLSRYWRLAFNLGHVLKINTGTVDSVFAEVGTVLLDPSHSQLNGSTTNASNTEELLIAGSLENECFRRMAMIHRVIHAVSRVPDISFIEPALASLCRSLLQNVCNISGGLRYHENQEAAGAVDTYSLMKARMLQRVYTRCTVELMSRCIRVSAKQSVHHYGFSTGLSEVVVFFIHSVLLPTLSGKEVLLDALLKQALQVKVSVNNAASSSNIKMPHVAFLAPQMFHHPSSLSVKTLASDLAALVVHNIRDVVAYAIQKTGGETIGTKLFEIGSLMGESNATAQTSSVPMIDHTTDLSFKIGSAFRKLTVSKRPVSRRASPLEMALASHHKEVEENGMTLYHDNTTEQQLAIERSRIIRTCIAPALGLTTTSKQRQVAILRMVVGIFEKSRMDSLSATSDCITVQVGGAITEGAMSLRSDICPLLRSILLATKRALVDEPEWQTGMLSCALRACHVLLMTPVALRGRVDECAPRSLTQWATAQDAMELVSMSSLEREFISRVTELLYWLARIQINEKLWIKAQIRLFSSTDKKGSADSGLDLPNISLVDCPPEFAQLVRANTKFKEVDAALFPQTNASARHSVPRNPYARVPITNESTSTPPPMYAKEKNAIMEFHKAMHPFFP
jgi:hypothetical protein